MMRGVSVLLMLLLSAPAAATEWHVDYEASRLGFSGVQTGARFDGRFERFDAAIRFDPEKLGEAQVAVEIDMASAITGNAQRDTAVKQPEWFDVASFPTAAFEVRKFRALGDGRYQARANLTIKGVSRRVSFPVAIEISGDTAQAEGAVTVDRAKFNVGTGQWASGQWVGRDVTISFALVARRKP